MSGTTDDPVNLPGEQPDPPEQQDGEPAATPADDETQGPEDEQPRGYRARDAEDRSPMDQRQTDAAWQEIVAELSDLSTDRARDLTAPPATEGGGFDFPVAPWVDAASDPAPEPVPRVQPSGHRSWVVGDEAQALQDAEGEFVPPDPDFELSADRLRNLGWFAVVAAPVLALLALVLWRDAPTTVYVALVGVFLAGAALLVWRMPTDRDEDSHGGGAVV